jgi:hypothetical protein
MWEWTLKYDQIQGLLPEKHIWISPVFQNILKFNIIQLEKFLEKTDFLCKKYTLKGESFDCYICWVQIIAEVATLDLQVLIHLNSLLKYSLIGKIIKYNDKVV